MHSTYRSVWMAGLLLLATNGFAAPPQTLERQACLSMGVAEPLRASVSSKVVVGRDQGGDPDSWRTTTCHYYAELEKTGQLTVFGAKVVDSQQPVFQRLWSTPAPKEGVGPNYILVADGGRGWQILIENTQTVVWKSPDNGKYGYALRLLDDGRLFVYSDSAYKDGFYLSENPTAIHL